MPIPIHMPLFRPALNSACLCGSGKKFKRCCESIYEGRHPGEKARIALNSGAYNEALIECRADITQYTVWHKSHTLPLLRMGAPPEETLLQIDINALAELAERLLRCYEKTNRLDEFPAVLERLRANIDADLWQRKIIYLNALHALTSDWNRQHAKKELKKLGSLSEETDVEILQLYADVFSDDLSFAETNRIVGRILALTKSEDDRLHYRGTQAMLHLTVGDNASAEHELRSSIAEYKQSYEIEVLNPYQTFRLAMSIALLGMIKNDSALTDEAIALYERALSRDEWTIAGRASILFHLGDAYRAKEAWDAAKDAYVRSLAVAPVEVCKVFVAECQVALGQNVDAERTLREVNTSNLEQAEFADYAFVTAALAIESRNDTALANAKILLRSLTIPIPLFRERRDSLVIQIIEAEAAGAKRSVAKRASAALRSLGWSASRYLKLEPNIMGVGVNIGRILEDLTNGTKEHNAAAITSSSSKTSK